VSWYDGGLRFECTRCGRCCTGVSGYVWVDEAEIIALARQLGLGLDDFGRRYLRRVGARYALIDRPGTGECVFYDGAACTVYPARPRQCRSFPFWPKNLASSDAWEATATCCEGIDDGAPLVTRDAIETMTFGPR
jgi:hypothetical protein